MKWLCKFVGRLPFCGKVPIRQRVFDIYQSTTVLELRRGYLRVLALLLCFILCHGVQAGMGIQALGFDSPIWARVISGLYCLANILVVLAQLYLVFRTTRFFFKKRLFETKRIMVNYSDTELATMLLVTLGGQIVFFSIYILYG